MGTELKFEELASPVSLQDAGGRPFEDHKRFVLTEF
jgi:hypothetical protein